jgi:hypothetical protein
MRFQDDFKIFCINPFGKEEMDQIYEGRNTAKQGIQHGVKTSTMVQVKILLGETSEKLKRRRWCS